MWIEAYFIVAAVMAVVILSICMARIRNNLRNGRRVAVNNAVEAALLLSLFGSMVWPLLLIAGLVVLVFYFLEKALISIFIKP